MQKVSKRMDFSLKDRFKSFKYAFSGLKLLIMAEHNARIHLLASFVAIILGFVYKINSIEWCLILIMIGLVVALELVNSALERVCDKISLDYSVLIKEGKDLAAAAVLVMAFVALIVGGIIFVPKIFYLK